MHTGIKLNDGKIYTKGHDGKTSEVVIIDEPVELDVESECTYGNAKVLEGATTTISLPIVHKEWYKKKKGGRWIRKYVIKPGWGSHKLGEFLGYYDKYPIYYEPTNLKFGYSKKKPRGKKAKEWRKIVEFNLNFMKNFSVDYTQYDNLYPCCVTPIKPGDETKFKAIVTKRIDDLKGDDVCSQK